MSEINLETNHKDSKPNPNPNPNYNFPLNHQAFSLVFEYSDSTTKRHLAKLITEYPLDLSNVELTFDELQTVKAPLIGLHLNRFWVPIPKTVRHLSAIGITLNTIPNNLETLKIKTCQLNTNLPKTLKRLEMESSTMTSLNHIDIEYIYLKDVSITNSQIFIFEARELLLHNIDLTRGYLKAERIELANIASNDLNFEIECKKLELYNVADMNMEQVNAKELLATKSLLSGLPKQCKIVDLAECYVTSYTPIDSLETFIFTGERTVEMQFPKSLKLLKINNVVMTNFEN